MFDNDIKWIEAEGCYSEIINSVYDILERLKNEGLISFVHDNIDFMLGFVIANRIQVFYFEKLNILKRVDIPVETLYSICERDKYIQNFK